MIAIVGGVLGLQLLAALLARGPGWRRALALAVALPNLLAAWQLPPGQVLARAIVALLTGFGSLRLLDLVLARRELSVGQRVWHAFALVDTPRLTYGRPGFDRAALGRALAYGALTALAAWVCLVIAPTLHGAPRLLARYGAGVVFMYALTDTAYAAITFLSRAGGVVVYELHRAPILARTVQEFWGARWATTVSALLFARTFKPLARRGLPRLGLAASFAASGVLHAYVVLPALGWEAAALWGLYFPLQGAFVVAELALGVARWRRPLAHAWVAAVMLGTSPMMVDPTLRLFA